MSRASTIDDASFWTTVEEPFDDDFTDVLPEIDDDVADWYQDLPEVTLPRECMPHWRTRH
jgi:hypothetical protein